MTDLALPESTNLISRKIWVTWILKFPYCVPFGLQFSNNFGSLGWNTEISQKFDNSLAFIKMVCNSCSRTGNTDFEKWRNLKEPERTWTWRGTWKNLKKPEFHKTLIYEWKSTLCKPAAAKDSRLIKKFLSQLAFEGKLHYSSRIKFIRILVS